MVSLLDLWLPIVLSGAAVWFLSFLMWMVLPHHRKDFGELPGEDSILAAVRAAGTKAGQYAFPFCKDMATMKTEAFQKKYADGPSGWVIVRPKGGYTMGDKLVKSFLYNVLMVAMVAYMATITMPAGAEGIDVFRFVTVGGFLAFAGALVWDAIWMSRSWRTTTLSLIDGVVFGAAVGAIFMFMWPQPV